MTAFPQRFTGSCQAVKRVVQKLSGPQRSEPAGIILTAPGEEAQVDYGSSPMVRDPQSGKYRRIRLFVLTLGYSRKSCACSPGDLATVPLLIINDLGMRKLGATAGEELLEIVMRRYERASTLPTSNRPVEDWGKLLGDSAAVTAKLDRLLNYGLLLKCAPRSWRTKTDLPDQEKAG